jgi:hypothetical protein
VLEELHDLLEGSGKAAAIAALGIDRRHLADAAAGFLGDDRHELAFVFSGWCLAALRQLRRSSMALDAYLWLAYRLHSLRGPTRVSWRALKAQFGGGGYRELFAFRQQFREALELALSVYPDAARHGVRIADDGLLLSPVAPPVSRNRAVA